MAHSVWKGSLSFGLLTIPIRLFTAARSERMNLHQIHQECKTRLRQPLFGYLAAHPSLGLWRAFLYWCGRFMFVNLAFDYLPGENH